MVFLIVPILTILGLSIHEAIGTSLACIAISSFSSAYTHLKKGKVHIKVVILKELFSIPAAVLGAYLTNDINEKILRVAFSMLLFYLAVRLTVKRRAKDSKEAKIHYERVPLVGVASGFLSGLLGISGGILNVPLFTIFVGIPIKYSIGTSSLALFFTALAGAITHLKEGNVVLSIALALAPGLIVGAYVGAIVSHRIHSDKLRVLFSALLLIIGVRMLV
ncbi:hypothetical protein PF1075 [Pyrococcus furiosus DSM 3638]|uniref:Probable membrane transporter protein n=1 Tax=Pyrococcus furiosus (strain ATCC 43587 / DSM 3638 / JCM 8422 / Vc1) TaxID=186497 RepID=Q8U1X9_PYRFU|nr:sulfite exporter TauE/SafE family protein [Pyrococcus furiosus]AAL81199.1 hypothetical protein PF1075 [Pyrococcus furiosus DSM 3638]